MRFDILRDLEQVATIRATLQEEHRSRVADRGQLVRYVMPPMPRAFPALADVLNSTNYRQQYSGIYYYIETKDRRLRRLVPAAEYYKGAFAAIADKQYSLRVGYRRVAELVRRIREAHMATRGSMLRAGQPSFNVSDEVYALKAEVANVLLVSRGALDTLATLMHFLYGPNSRQFMSFVDFVKFLRRTANEHGQSHDPELLAHITAHLDWFWLLRDYRDFVTHVSSIDVAFYEAAEGTLNIFLDNVTRADLLTNRAVLGLHEFCEFIDLHFARRVKSVAGAA